MLARYNDQPTCHDQQRFHIQNGWCGASAAHRVADDLRRPSILQSRLIKRLLCDVEQRRAERSPT
jgi:hypothetical protein